MADRDIDLVLITGAGASREFGQGGQTLPLMGDWAERVTQKLSQRGINLVDLVGLGGKLSGPDFESRLGMFLQQSRALPGLRRFIAPSLRSGLVSPLNEESLQTWFQHVESQIGQAMIAIHESLQEEFGWDRVDPLAASAAYGELLKTLGLAQGASLVYATTNYDLLGEYALGQLDRIPDAGETHGVQPGGPVPVRVEGLLDGLPRYTPILHLHGRVGWYRRDGHTTSSPGNTRYDPGFGDPVVMLPDPVKDYAADPLVYQLWEELGRALRRARRVLVLGHSLGDEALIQALSTNVEQTDRIAITVLPPPGQQTFAEDDPTVVTARTRLGGAHIVPFRFDRETAPTGARPFKNWLDNTA